MRLLIFILILGVAILAGRAVYHGFMAESLLAWSDGLASRDAALAHAPANPVVIAARAKYLSYRAEEPDEAQGLAELRRAVRLTPSDYRYWLELGRAAENAGELVAAGQAFARARQLAPGYFETHWTWANFKLRNGEVGEAEAAFRQALLLSENRPGVTNGRAALNVYDALAQAVGLDLEMLRRVAPPDLVAQSYLAWYLASRQAIDPALEIFRRIPHPDSPAQLELIQQLLAATQGAGRYTEAREVWDVLRSISGLPAEAAGNLIENGGFEREPMVERYEILRGAGLGFDWLIDRHAEVTVRRDDDRPHGGERSLLVGFSMGMTTPFANLSQQVVVEPGRRYSLTFQVRTRNIPAAPPWVEIVDAQRPEALNLNLPLPAGAGDWQTVNLDFVTPPGTCAIRVVLRSPLYRELSGINRVELHLDDFSLVRVD
jgi:cytochrome c-type biogenesis protein CcmH/NrfG